VPPLHDPVGGVVVTFNVAVEPLQIVISVVGVNVAGVVIVTFT
jgi:hypothetical protein